jgi:geranylgeranylglycerol-phosphate geranylgeranyltransferase
MAINDYHDYEADKINRRMDRPLVRNPDLKPHYVLYGSILMIGLGVLIAFFLFSTNLLVPLGVIVFSFLSLSYNLWTKEQGILGNITVAVSNTAPYLLTLVALEATDPSTILVVLVMSIITFCGVLGRELVKGVMDIEGDRITNSRTFAVQYGPKRAVRLASFLFILLILLIPLPMFIKFQNNYFYLILMVITVSMFLYTVIILYKDPSIKSGIKARSYTRTALWIGSAAFLVGALALSGV